MLKDKIREYILEKQASQDSAAISIFKEEKDYAERNQLLEKGLTALIEENSNTRFLDAYIERCDKGTEETLSIEPFTFLNEPIKYLKNHKSEFIYLEANWFDLIGVDAVSLEVDDVFGTYDVMLGLKLQKKFEIPLKEYLNTYLHGDEAKFDLLFNRDDGLWNLNFTLNYVETFKEEMIMREAYQIIYDFLFHLVEAVEEGKR